MWSWCRLAMLGFVWAVIGEKFQGKDLFEQVASAPNLIVAVVALITVASAVPFYRGVKRSGNPIFTADAELWNGRLAMVSASPAPCMPSCLLLRDCSGCRTPSLIICTIFVVTPTW